MIIDRVTLHHLRMPLVAPFETSFGRITDRECILIEVAADGLIGWGECVADRDPGYAYETAGTAWHILRDFLVPAILGQDVAGPADFQARVRPCAAIRWPKLGWRWRFGISWENKTANHYMNYLEAMRVV